MFSTLLAILAAALLTGATSVTSLASTRSSGRLRDPEVFNAGYFPDLLDELSYDPDVRIAVGRASLEALSEQRSLRSFTAKSSFRPASGLVALIAQEGFEAGMDPSYLVRLAHRESNFDRFAGAPTSTAAGLFQFTENTWLCSLKEFGPGLGVSGAAAIWRNGRGLCGTSTPEARSRLLALRSDVSLSTRITAAFSIRNYQTASLALRRPPTAAELYALHFFGEEVGLKFLSAKAESPSLPAIRLSQAAAAANPALFFAEDGSEKSVGQLYEAFNFQ